MLPRVLLALAVAGAPSAFAATFKCVSPEGRVTFASVPCPPGGGETTYVPPAQGNDPAMAEMVRRRNVLTTQSAQYRTYSRGQSISVVADHTKGSIEDQKRQAAREARQGRIAAGLEAPRPKPVYTNCFGNELVTTCTDSAGGMSNTTHMGGISTGTYYPGNP